MCPDGYLKTSSQTYFLMIMNLGHRFISAYSKWHSYTAQNNFCPVTTSLIKCQFLLQISCLYKQRPKQITVANVHHSEHLLVSVQRMVSLEQSMSLLLKIQVTWSFWKKKKNCIRWPIWDDDLHIHILMKTVLVVCFSVLMLLFNVATCGHIIFWKKMEIMYQGSFPLKYGLFSDLGNRSR